jgi:hypothetical protein
MALAMGVTVGGKNRPGDGHRDWNRITIEQTPGRWVVRIPDSPGGIPGTIRIDRMQGLLAQATKHGLTWVEVTAAAMLRGEEAAGGRTPATGRAFALLTESVEEGRRWRDEIEARIPANLDPVTRWVRGPDYGRSAGALAFLLTGIRHPSDSRLPGDLASLPGDAEEFGRCLSLLRTAPDLRLRLCVHLAEDVGGWGPLVALWPALEAAVEAGEANRVDAALKLLAETRKKRSWSNYSNLMEEDGWTGPFPAALLRVILPGATDDQLLAACAASGAQDPARSGARV